jgi:UDP-2,3-diacylglucosamine pyrophosphatase LpxH
VSLFKRASKLSPDEYQEAIDKGLNRAFEDAKRDTVDISALKVVVFSDLHRGARDRADDFERCERAYSAALGWYLEQRFALYLLGDIEELWENAVKEVLPEYTAVLQLEKDFATGPGLRRFYGNHDLDWSQPKRVAKNLAEWLPGLEVAEALRLRVLDDTNEAGLLFFVHGHQGTSMSERWAWLSRLVLRYLWRAIQRTQGWLSTTPAESLDLRHKHDIAMNKWVQQRVLGAAKAERPVLIAGHTHHPVFPGKPPKRPGSSDEAELRERLERERDDAQRRTLRAELELVRARLREDSYDPPLIDPPCYFNSGCCCFPDRDVTCLEISGERLEDVSMNDEHDGRGKIRLMRWLNDQAEPRPKQLAALPLRDVFQRVAAT